MPEPLRLFRAGHCTHPEFMVMRGGRYRIVEFPSLFALVDHPRLGPLLYDTGYSRRFLDLTRAFPDRLYAMVTPVSVREEETAVEQLRRVGIRPEDIRTVVLSHFHADHISGLADFPRATYVFARAAYEAVRSLRGLGRVLAGFLPGTLPPDFEQRARPLEPAGRSALPEAFRPLEKAHDLAGDGSLLVVDLPGHVAGHVGLIVREPAGDTFLVGDACWLGRAVRENRMPHPLVRLITHDWAAYGRTLGHLHQVALSNPGLRLIPSHCTEAHERFDQA